jgi:RNA polymerase sigma factor (sigma-70 family)
MQRVADSSLLGAAQGGGDRAFADLVAPLVDAGYRLACAMLRDPQAAEDVMQEASFTAWRRLAKVQDQTKLRPWFLSIVANECRNARRLRWFARVKLGLPPAASVRSDEDRILRGADLARALSQLGERDRLVILLHFYLDLPLEEVASIAGSSVGATRRRMYRSIRRLRPDLEIEEALR